MNQAYCRTFAKAAGYLLGTQFIESVPPAHRTAVYDAVKKFLAHLDQSIQSTLLFCQMGHYGGLNGLTRPFSMIVGA